MATSKRLFVPTVDGCSRIKVTKHTAWRMDLLGGIAMLADHHRTAQAVFDYISTNG